MTDDTTTYVMSYSGGVTSWAAAKLLVDAHGPGRVTLLFADTLIESPDVYRFLDKGAEVLGMSVTRVADGRTPWEVMKDERMIGSNLRAVCSKILKRKVLDRWRRENCDPKTSIHAVGMDWLEMNRFKTHQRIMAERGWTTSAPLIEARLDKPDAIRMAKDAGLAIPDAYREGFSHANCAGTCIRAGFGHWKRLLAIHPDRYRRAEAEEKSLQEYLGRTHTILTRTATTHAGDNGEPEVNYIEVSLKDLRLEEEARLRDDPNRPLPLDDGGGCGCALEAETA